MTMKTPTTQEAKDLILWLYSTDTQHDETPATGRRRYEAVCALKAWAEKPLDTKNQIGLRSGNVNVTLSKDAKKLKLALKQ
jgi:hypothetical protein